MQAVDDAIERILRLPHASVGSNYGQDREANDWIAVSEKRVTILKQLVLPHQLPDEYLYFLEHYGGFHIEDVEAGLAFFSIFGFLPQSRYAISNDALATFYEELYERPELADALVDDDVIVYNLSSPRKKLGHLYIGIWHDYHSLTDEELRSVPINPETGEQYSPFDVGYPEFRLSSVLFYLDIAGDMQQYAVFASHDGENKRMQKIAGSFTKWLEEVAETGGDFSYVAKS